MTRLTQTRRRRAERQPGRRGVLASAGTRRPTDLPNQTSTTPAALRPSPRRSSAGRGAAAAAAVVVVRRPRRRVRTPQRVAFPGGRPDLRREMEAEGRPSGRRRRVAIPSRRADPDSRPRAGDSRAPAGTLATARFTSPPADHDGVARRGEAKRVDDADEAMRMSPKRSPGGGRSRGT
ncbi:hypothetical protein THAOC_25362 [Thalassiosira oceanica]|uniref:Uncharacterized protein n=1 Tax=Thalassiosira oceanica TaxID=159749 RepID=K0RMJ6_THAOC|nr:hypothetical protein THAOC_25362 [Thalassiosira oceanica]|eukprot:EJK54963.1 hypothetical protein THAOC_25362 [Thalassiosira oceanica]